MVRLDGERRVDHVPVLDDGRIVELQHQPAVDDGLVLLAHRRGARVDELLLGLVVLVADPRGLPGAIEVMNPSSTPAAFSPALKCAMSAAIAALQV
jgi:hypothetical protein